MKKVLVGAVVFGLLVLAVFWYLGKHPDTLPEVQEVIKQPIPQLKAPKTFEELRAEAASKIVERKAEAGVNVVDVDLSPIAGRRLGDLYVRYLGLPAGTIPSRVQVSFDEQMVSMYHQKVMFEKCKKNGSCTVASDTVLSQAPSLLTNYLQADKLKMGLSDFIRVAEEKVALGKRSIDWSALCQSRAYKLTGNRCALLQDVVTNLTGRDLVVYGMTELLPSDDGKLNVKYMDILLRHAGAQFLYHVPALGDRYASLGLYQFTFFALRKDDEEVAGASVVNTFVKEGGDKIPDSVVLLSGHQHHTAAFYFAVHNLASLISRLDAEEVKVLQAVHEEYAGEMVVIIAAAHHAPAHTFPTAERWLRNVGMVKGLISPPKKKKGKGKKHTAEPPPETVLVSMFPASRTVALYARKSAANLEAVYDWK